MIRTLVARLRPEERLAIVYLAAVGVLFAARGLPFTVGALVVEYLKFFLAITAVVVPPWAVVQAVRFARGRGDRTALQSDLVELVRPLAAYLAILVAYTNLKSRLLALHPRLFDPILDRLDALALCGGCDLTAWTEAAGRGARWIGALDWLYLLAWLVLALPLGVAVARHGGAVFRRAVAALGIAYAAGSLVYVAVPALGPAFVERARFMHLGATSSFAVQESMQRALRFLAEHPDAPSVPFFGIAAFPSLHLATTWLGVLVAWRHARALVPLVFAANLAIAAAAFFLGWHYAIDFPPGIALAALAWWLAGRWVAPPPAAVAESPPPAPQ